MNRKSFQVQRNRPELFVDDVKKVITNFGDSLQAGLFGSKTKFFWGQDYYREKFCQDYQCQFLQFFTRADQDASWSAVFSTGDVSFFSKKLFAQPLSDICEKFH